MTRRAFLAVLGAGATAATVSACSGVGAGDNDLLLVPNDWDFFAGTNDRLAVLLASNALNGAPVRITAPITLQVRTSVGPLGPPAPMVVRSQGLNGANYAVTTHRFPQPGSYVLEASYRGRRLRAPVTVTDPAASAVPVTGSRLVGVGSPTTGDPMGVDPICTRVPPCPFHEISLDQAMGLRRPIALVFATPALCQSRFCGPVLDNVVAVHGRYAGRVTFIHSEIYTDLRADEGTPPVRAFHLEHEPMLYLAGPDNIIRARIDNLIDQSEARDALDRLVAA
jgi:hypothetical protein